MNDEQVGQAMHEAIRSLSEEYDYGPYPATVEKDIAAMNRVYIYFTGRGLGNE